MKKHFIELKKSNHICCSISSTGISPFKIS